MAQTVDTLIVRIEADMKDMRRALRRVEGNVSKSTKRMSGSFGKLGKAMKVLAAAVIVRQGVIAGQAMINLASDIEEMQGKSKVVFGKFRTDVVKELEAFGNSVGRSTHELEGMAATVQDTFVPMGFARGEAAKLSVAMTKLAVDTASFNNANDTDTIRAFQSALVGNHETVRRFGVVITEATLNQELLNMGIEGGAKAASNAEKVQARLNLITKGVSDAQGDALRTAGSYANSMRGLKSEFAELAGAIGTVFLPVVTETINLLKRATTATKVFLQDIGFLSTPIDDALKRTRESIIETQAVLKNFSNMANPTPEFIEEFGHLLGAMEYDVPAEQVAAQQKKLKELIDKENSLIQDLKAQRTSLAMPLSKESEDGDKGPTDEFKDQLAAVEALTLQTRKLGGLRTELHYAQTGNQVNLTDKIKEQIRMEELLLKYPALEEKNLKKLASALFDTEYASNAYAQALANKKKTEDEYNESAQAGLAIYENKSAATLLLKEQEEQLMDAVGQGLINMNQMEDAMARLTAVIPPVNQAFEQMKDRVQTTFDTMSDSLTQMVMDGKIKFSTMRDMFKDMVRQMIADALKAQVIKPILGGIFGGIGGFLGGSADGGGTNIGNAFLQVAAGAKQGASGGQFHSGEPYLVGERGPELIVPSSAGTIMNNHNTRSAMGRGGGTVVNQTINVQSGVAQTVRAEMISLLPRFKQDTMNAVVDAKRRGGSFGQAFG
jgi:hypothetical protein